MTQLRFAIVAVIVFIFYDKQSVSWFELNPNFITATIIHKQPESVLLTNRHLYCGGLGLGLRFVTLAFLSVLYKLFNIISRTTSKVDPLKIASNGVVNFVQRNVQNFLVTFKS